jgi:uncharacterized protein DUF2490
MLRLGRHRFEGNSMRSVVNFQFGAFRFARHRSGRRVAVGGALVPGSRLQRRLCLALLIWLGRASIVFAQESSLEFWPEVDVWWRLTPTWRLSMFAQIAKNSESNYREWNLYLQGDYAFWRMSRQRITRSIDESRALQMKRFLVRSGYLAGRSLGDDAEAYREKTMFAELHVRTPIKGGFLFTHRVRTDLRWLGTDPEFSNRLRYRLMVERECKVGRWSIVPFANGEPYYDSRYDIVNRTRWIGGASVSWSPRFAIEGNWIYQHDTRASLTKVNALGVILHVFFEKHGAK